MRFAVEATGAFRLVFGAHVVELQLASIPETRTAGRTARARLEGALGDFLAESGASMPLATLMRLVWAYVHGTAELTVERELGRDFDLDDAIALARDGVLRLLSTV